MSLAPTRRSRRVRPDLDKSAVRYFVYRLADETGAAVYIGRSCDVRNRIKAHGDTEWIQQVRSVSLVGPLAWDAAVAEERRQIEREQPWANKDLTARDRRPMTASRSAANAAS